MKSFFSQLVVAFVLLGFASCSSEGDIAVGQKIMDKTGYEFILHKKGTGPKVKINDYVFLSAVVMDDKNSVLQELTDPENYPSFQLLPPDSLDKPNPIFSILTRLVVGDSVTIYFPKDSLGQGNMDPSIQFLAYNFAVKDAMDETGYKAYTEKKVAENQKRVEELAARLPEVETRVKGDRDAFNSKKLTTQKTESGLEYFIHEQGTGKKVESGMNATVHYYGILKSDGKLFDSSFTAGNPITFKVGVGQVIKGWDEGLTLLNVGSKATLFIPSALAYGEMGAPGGAIPPNSDLIFYVEIVDAK